MDYILGVINWRELADTHLTEDIQSQIGALFDLPPEQKWQGNASAAVSAWADGPNTPSANHAMPDISPDMPKDIAEYLRNLPITQPDDCIAEDDEFALALIRRDPSGKSHVIAGIPKSAKLLEQALRKLVM